MSKAEQGALQGVTRTRRSPTSIFIYIYLYKFILTRRFAPRRLDFTIRLCSTMAAVAAGARSIIAGVSLLWLFGRLFITTTIAIHAVTDGAACRLLLFRGEVSAGEERSDELE